LAEHLFHGDYVGECESYRQETETAATEMQISLYPNPAGDHLTLSILSAAGEEMQISIFDLLGNERLVYPMATAPAEVTLDLSVLTSGSYLISVRANGTQRMIHFVKQ
jgi:hypothetical protein